MQTKNTPLVRLEMDEVWVTEQTNKDKSAQIVEIEILPPMDINDRRKVEIYNGIAEIDEKLDAISARIEELNAEIDSLTNHADGLDYTIAVASGILTGLIDSFFVGETDIKGSIEKVDKSFTEKVKKKALSEKQDDAVKKALEGAKKKGRTLSKDEIEEIKKNVAKKFYSDPNHLAEQGKDPVLKRAISFLEKKHPTPQDNLYRGTGGAPSNHHLHDIAHHASLGGMVASIVVQFLRVATFANKDGELEFKFVGVEPKELLDIWLPIAVSGLLNWLVYVSENTIKTEDGEKLPEPIIKLAHLLASTPAIIQVIKAVDNWFLHLFSDVAGSRSSKGRGAGIPGLFISLLKELSIVPPLNLTGLPQAIDYLYTNKKIDLRAEIGIAKELGRQTLPIIINEVLVRTFYFVRRLIVEYKKNESFEGVDWQNVIPFGNRTVERMMTIASGTFMAFDVADAAIRSGGFNASCILRINFVGIGRFAIAIGTDFAMGIKKRKKEAERSEALSAYISLANIKVYYRKADLLCSLSDLYNLEANMYSAEKDVWQEVQYNADTMAQLYEVITRTCQIYVQAIDRMDECSEAIVQSLPAFDQTHPGVREKMLRHIKGKGVKTK